MNPDAVRQLLQERVSAVDFQPLDPESIIEAGRRRRRRRKVAASVALGAAAIAAVVTGVALGGGSPSAENPATVVPASPSPATPTPPSPTRPPSATPTPSAVPSLRRPAPRYLPDGPSCPHRRWQWIRAWDRLRPWSVTRSRTGPGRSARTGRTATATGARCSIRRRGSGRP